MRYGRLLNDVVVEVIDTDADIATMFHPALQWVPIGDEVQVGWVLVDGVLSAPTPYQAPVNVPLEVTMRQARLALFQVGKLAQVDAAIDALSEPQRTVARIEWDHSQTVQRHKQLVQALAPALDLADADLDQLFVLASAL